jgi:polysaccharide deacetylase family sporulation protein PdaB
VRVFVLTKRTLILILAVLVLLIGALVILLTKHDGGSESGIQRPMAADETLAAVSAEKEGLQQYELEVLAGKQRELPIYCVQRTDKKIALTIDAAWEDDKTAFILEELDRQNVKATFYLCGHWVDKYPEHVKDIAARGHELGNHTDTHPHMNKLDTKGIEKEINDLDDKIEKLTGKRSKTFRAPFGEYNDLVVTSARALGYEIVQWDIDTVDWREERSTQTILNSVLPKLKPGSVILCHNNGFKIEEYLPILIGTAKEEGYEFVTISDLLLSGSAIIDVNGMQKPM